MSKGIFLGAGFSYDMGMPLAKDVTKDFFSFFNKKRMLKLANNWANHLPYGKDKVLDKEDILEVVNIIEKYRDKKCSNYELIFEEIESSKWNESHSYRYVYARLLDTLIDFFLIYQEKSYKIYEYTKEFYKELFNQLGDEPVWAITLNHDVNLELLCLDNTIPMSYGGVNQRIFPLSKKNFEERFKFSSVARNKLHLSDMEFIKKGFGLNILKLHGALNELNYGDSEEVIMLDPDDYKSSKDYLNDVLRVHRLMKYKGNGMNNDIGVFGEIAVSDLEGKLQFLRKTIKTGGNKYSTTLNSKKGEEKLTLLDEVLKDIDELIIIGYGFNDKHINNRLLKAMYRNDEMRLSIIDPYQINNELLNPFRYGSRVLGCQSPVPEWLHYEKNNNWNITENKKLKAIRETRKTWNKMLRNNVFK